MNKTMIGLQPDTPIPLDRPRVSGVRPRRVFLGTPVHIPPPRRQQRRQQTALSKRGEQVLAALIVCYLIAFWTAAIAWL
jgi:hypothetical protein